MNLELRDFHNWFDGWIEAINERPETARSPTPKEFARLVARIEKLKTANAAQATMPAVEPHGPAAPVATAAKPVAADAAAILAQVEALKKAGAAAANGGGGVVMDAGPPPAARK